MGTEGTGSTLPWSRGHVLEPPVYCTLWRRPSSSLPCTGCGKAPSTGRGLARCHRDCTWALGPRVSRQSLEPCSPLLRSPGEEAEGGAVEAGWWSPLGAVWSRGRAPWRDPRGGTLPGTRSRPQRHGWEAAGCPLLRGTWAPRAERRASQTYRSGKPLKTHTDSPGKGRASS